MKRVKHFLLSIPFVTLLVSCSGSGNKPSLSSLNYTTPEKFIVDANFNGSLLFKKDNVDIVRRGFGLADSNNNTVNDVSTKFRIGSLTKAFTGMAIVQLKKEGLIANYSDKVSVYLPSYPRGNEIEIKDLLNHTSGIAEYTTNTLNTKQTFSPEQLVDLFKNSPLTYTPGQRFVYTNSNYALLGLLVEKISGMSYYNYLNERVLLRLGMSNTEYGSSVIAGSGYAKGYIRSVGTPASFIDMSIPYASGALSSNIVDMEKWADSFLNNDIIDNEDKNDILTPSATSTTYGFGWDVKTISGKQVYTHAGRVSGFDGVIAIFPNDNAIFIALSNIESGESEINQMLEILSEKEL